MPQCFFVSPDPPIVLLSLRWDLGPWKYPSCEQRPVFPKSSACGSMPSIHMPLRHHPSSQTMRHVDGSQDRTEPNVAAAQHPLSRDNGSNRGQQPQIQVQDFQNHDWPSSRRPSVGNASISSRLKANTTPSMPDLYQHLKQVPIPPGSAIQWY